MKKFNLCLCITFFLLTIPLSVSASSMSTYSIPKLNMTIKLPSKWYVITPYTPKNDIVFQNIKYLTYIDSVDCLIDEGDYLFAVDPVTGSEVEITMFPNKNDSIYDYNLLNKKELEKQLKNHIKTYSSSDVKYTNYSINKSSQATYFIMEKKDTDVGCCSKEHYTILNGKPIDIEYTIYDLKDKPFPPSQAKIYQNIINSIHFTKITKKLSSGKIITVSEDKKKDKSALLYDVSASKESKHPQSVLAPSDFAFPFMIIIILLSINAIMIIIMAVKQKRKSRQCIQNINTSVFHTSLKDEVNF